MSEQYRFFNSTELDPREYQASEFAEYFGMFLSDGVYTNNGLMGLAVSTISGLNVKVGTGVAFVRGYLYKNDADIAFTLDVADTVLDRIDRIVLKLDIVNRTINIAKKKGAMGSSPTPPTLVDDASVKEIPIVQIRLNKNATTGIITDERAPVSSLIEIPLGDMENTFNAWFSTVQANLGQRVLSGTTEPADIQTGDYWFKELV